MNCPLGLETLKDLSMALDFHFPETQWEYEVAHGPDKTTLTKYGNAGWELVSVSNHQAYFKRKRKREGPREKNHVVLLPDTVIVDGEVHKVVSYSDGVLTAKKVS